MILDPERRSGIGSLMASFAWFLLVVALSGTALAGASEPVAITGDGDLVLRSHVRAVFEKDTPLAPEDIVRLADTSGIPHPVSPPSYGRFSQPVWGYVSVQNRGGAARAGSILRIVHHRGRARVRSQ